MPSEDASPRLLVLLILTLTTPVAWCQTSKAVKQAGSELMNGEKILPVKEAPLLNPICRFDEHPWFEITELRPGRNLQDALQMNFACSGSLEGQFHVVVTTNGKRHHFPLDDSILKKRRGVITCKYSFLDDKSPFGANIEAYIELTDDEPKTTSTTFRYRNYSQGGYGRGSFGYSRPSSYTYRRTEAQDPLFFKVSKSATRGDVPAITFAREIRPDELRLYTARRKKNGPPPPPPAGTSIASIGTPPVPGTPILAAFEGDWLPAEVLSVEEKNMFVVHWPKFGHAKNALVRINGIAVKEAIQEKLEAAPDSFSPSVTVPLGSLQPITEGYIVPEESLKLLPGTPVKVFISRTGHDYTVIEDNGASVNLVYDSHGAIKHLAKRASVTISASTAKALSKPETKDVYAARLRSIQDSAPARRTRAMSKPEGYGAGTRHYGITIPIPDDQVAVTKNTPLPVGTKVSAFWGSKFNDAEVRELHDDGSVVIKWTDWRSVYPVTRETLIISKAVLAAIENKEKGADTKMAESQEDRNTSDGQDTFRLSLKKITKSKKILVCKIIMEMTGLDLPTALEVVANVPLDVKDGLSKKEADDWRKQLAVAGAEVDIKPTKRKPAVSR